MWGRGKNLWLLLAAVLFLFFQLFIQLFTVFEHLAGMIHVSIGVEGLPVEFFVERRQRLLRVENAPVGRKRIIRGIVRYVGEQVAEIGRPGIVLVEIGNAEAVP